MRYIALFAVILIVGFYADVQSQIFPEAKSSNPEAVKLYKEGAQLAAVGTAGELPRAQWEKGVGLLKKAIELDPGFSAAYFVLGESYRNGNISLYEKTEDEEKNLLEWAKVEYRKAADLDPLNPVFLSEVASFTKDKSEELRLFKRVLEIDPNYPLPPMTMAYIADSDGKVEEAFEQLVQELKYSLEKDRCLDAQYPENEQYGFKYFAKKYPDRYKVFVGRVCRGENLPAYENPGGE